MTEYVYVTNPHTSEIHRVMVVDGVKLSAEQCNQDDMSDPGAASEEEAEELLAKAGYDRCGHCWKQEDEPDE
jgi:hypothetical protein